MQLPNEQWTRLTYENQFLISSYGRIFCTKTKYFIRPYIHKSRANYYLRVNIGPKKYMLHVLVAKHFVNYVSVDHIEVDHLDGNTLNPAAYNLVWSTKSDNKYKMWKFKRINVFNTTLVGKYKPIKGTKKVYKQ